MLADIDHACTELFREGRDRLEVVTLHAQELRRRERRWYVLLRFRASLKVVDKVRFALELGFVCVRPAWFVCGSTKVLIFDIFWAQDRYLCEQEFPLDAVGICVVQDSPYRYLECRS